MSRLPIRDDRGRLTFVDVDDGIPPLQTFGYVMGAFEEAGLDIRDAYWGHPHRPTDGDKDLILVVGGQDYAVAGVRVDGDRIVVETVRSAVRSAVGPESDE